MEKQCKNKLLEKYYMQDLKTWKWKIKFYCWQEYLPAADTQYLADPNDHLVLFLNSYVLFFKRI